MTLLSVLKHHHIAFTAQLQSSEIVLKCPVCERAKLGFNTTKLVGQCFTCGWSGNQRALYQFLNIRFFECLEDLSLELTPSLFPLEKLATAIDANVSILPVGLIPASASEEACVYLQGRGLSFATMNKFALMYCPEGFYARRIIIPVCNRHGEYTTWVGRAIDSTVQPKYLYPRGNSISKFVYNLHRVRGTVVYLTEGVFDSIHCAPFGVAIFGKEVSDAQIIAMRVHGIRQVFLLLDAEASQKTPQLYAKVLHKLQQHFLTFSVKLECDTPTEFSLGELQEMCEAAI